jgi:hypothetical protein
VLWPKHAVASALHWRILAATCAKCGVGVAVVETGAVGGADRNACCQYESVTIHCKALRRDEPRPADSKASSSAHNGVIVPVALTG